MSSPESSPSSDGRVTFDDSKTSFDDSSKSRDISPSSIDKVQGDLSARNSTDLEDVSSVTEPEEPYHVYKTGTQIAIVALVSLAATFSPLSSNIYFPAQEEIGSALNMTPTDINLSITTYMIAQALAPSFWGPISDVSGRRMILIATMVLYVGANIGLALVQNAAMLYIFRFIQAAGSSSTISICSGIISDIATPQKRGGFYGYFSGARQVSIAIGPVLGGLLSGGLGFRSIFWFLTIFSGAVVVLLILVLPETMRSIAGNGSIHLTSWTQRAVLQSLYPAQTTPKADLEQAAKDLDSGIPPKKSLQLSDFFAPFKMVLEKDVACALWFGACVYTSWSMVTSSTTTLFTEVYGLSTIEIGLCFLANGVGCVLGSLFSARKLDRQYAKTVKLWHHDLDLPSSTPMPNPRKNLPAEFPLERARLSDVPLHAFFMIFASLIYGWSLTSLSDPSAFAPQGYAVPEVVPLIAQLALGFSATAVLNGNQTLMVDLHPEAGASATAVNNLARCLLGAVGVAVVQDLLSAIGAGWTSTILAGLVLAGTAPMVLMYWYGEEWRKQRHAAKTKAALEQSAEKGGRQMSTSG